MAPSNLHHALLAALWPDDAVAEQLRGESAVEAILTRLVAEARAAWPSIELDERRYVAHVARGLRGSTAALGALETIHGADLFLALACGESNALALAVFERDFISTVPEILARMGRSIPVDEVAQALRLKLLVAEGGSPPKVLEFSGSGPLAGWLRIVAIRTALDLIRRGTQEGARHESDRIQSPS